MTERLTGYITRVHSWWPYGTITYRDDTGEIREVFVHKNNLRYRKTNPKSAIPRDENGNPLPRRPLGLRLGAKVTFVLGEHKGRVCAKKVKYANPDRKRKNAETRRQKRRNGRGGGNQILPVTYLPG